MRALIMGMVSINKSSLSQVIKNKFVKNVSLVMSGTVFSQLITIVTAPILSRIFTSADMGIFSIYLSISGILSLVAALRYETAIVLPKNNEEASQLLVLSCIIVVLMSMLTEVLILACGDLIAEAFGTPELMPWLIWIPTTIFFTGIFQCLNFWSTRSKKFRRLSISQMFRSGAVSTTQIVSGALGLASSGLIVGQVAGQLAATVVIGYQTYDEEPKIFKTRPDIPTLKLLAKKYKEFPMFSTPQTLANASSQQLPIFLLAIYYGAEVVGLYAIALRLLQLPVTLVSQSVRQVFLQKASSSSDDVVHLHLMFKKLTVWLAIIALIPSVLFITYGHVVFEVVMGPQWGKAGDYAQWIILWLFFSFINPPSVVMSTIFGMQKMLLIYETFLLLFRFGVLVVGGLYFSAMGAIAAYSMVGAAFNIFLIFYILTISKRRSRICLHQAASNPN